MQDAPRNLRTPAKVLVLIYAAAAGGLLLTIAAELAFFFVVSDFPNAFDWWDKLEVTYDNRTNATVYVYLDDRLEVTIPAHQSRTITDRKIFWWIGRRVMVQDQAGGVILATKLDDGDLEKQHFRIEISQP